MCACGEVSAIIRTVEEWQQHTAGCPSPGAAGLPDFPFPFYVLSIAINAEGEPPVFSHHFFGIESAKELIQLAVETSPCVAFVDGSISGAMIEEMQAHGDDRGWLAELFRKDDLRRLRRRGRITADDPQMMYMSMTRVGQMRGPHSHVVQTDVFVFVSSKFEMFMWDDRSNSTTYRHRFMVTTDPKALTRVIVPAGVVHAYRALDKDGLTVNCPDQLYRGWDKKKQVDEVRWEGRADSPFQPW